MLVVVRGELPDEPDEWVEVRAGTGRRLGVSMAHDLDLAEITRQLTAGSHQVDGPCCRDELGQRGLSRVVVADEAETLGRGVVILRVGADVVTSHLEDNAARVDGVAVPRKETSVGQDVLDEAGIAAGIVRRITSSGKGRVTRNGRDRVVDEDVGDALLLEEWSSA